MFLYRQGNLISTTSQRRDDAAEMKLLRLLASYTLLDYKTNESNSQELNIPSIYQIELINIDQVGFYTGEKKKKRKKNSQIQGKRRISR